MKKFKSENVNQFFFTYLTDLDQTYQDLLKITKKFLVKIYVLGVPAKLSVVFFRHEIQLSYWKLFQSR